MKRSHPMPVGENRIPRHIAVIMDGNGRWARRHGLPRRRGHLEGAESVRVLVRECARLGVREVTLYAFSTENWRRPRTEVQFLMSLLARFLRSEREDLMRNNIRLRAIGDLEPLPRRVREELDRTIAMTRSNTGMVVRLALNYGGRQEILHAARRVAREARSQGLRPDDLTESRLAGFLYDDQMTDPDLLIRTGGEMRLSNFLLWHLSYTELWFTRTCWPEFRAAQLRQALQAYARRERRYGALGQASRARSAHAARSGR